MRFRGGGDRKNGLNKRLNKSKWQGTKISKKRLRGVWGRRVKNRKILRKKHGAVKKDR